MDKRLRPACRLAVEVALAGEQADPRVPAPAALRPVLGFTRLSAAAYGVIERVIDDDGTFRARVAEAAGEAPEGSPVGRAGWLWLHRPVDWRDDEAFAGGEQPLAEPAATARRPDREQVAKHRRAAQEADAARKRATDQLADVRRELDATRRELDAVAARVDVLQEERNAAVRASKASEASLAAARRDLKAARQANREVEAELLRLRSEAEARPAPAPAAPSAPPAPSTVPAPAAVAPEVAQSVAAAAGAAADLASALAAAAAALAPAVPVDREATSGTAPEGAVEAVGGKAGRGAGKAKGKAAKGKGASKEGRRRARAVPSLPPGTFDGTPEAHRHLLASSANLVIVDGYNLARAAWPGLAPEEERRRTVALLDDVQARSGGRVVVVFDGDDAVTAPLASRTVLVRYSATGQTADDAIADLVRATPPTVPVVVVSSDKAVARDARRQGAVAMGSLDLLRATGR